MRKVKVYQNIKQKSPDGFGSTWIKTEIGRGLFHIWSTDYEEFDGGPGQFPIAVIEMDDGKILTPRADMIEFIK